MANSGSFKTNAYDGRYLKFTWSVSNQSIANNTTTISWTLAGAGTASVGYYKAGNFKVVIDGTTVYSSSTRINLYDGTVVKSGTYTLTHGKDGKRTFLASAEGGIYTTAVNCKGSGAFTLPDIPRASTIVSVSGSKITDSFSVKYTKALSNYTDNLQINVKGKSVAQTISNYSSGATFKLSDTLKNAIYSSATNSSSVSLEFQLVTYNGSSKVGTSEKISKSVSINDSVPTIGTLSYKDTNTNTVVITNDNQKIIRNYSSVSVTVSNMSARNGATLSKLSLSIGDKSKSISLSGTSGSQTVSLGKINISNDSALTAKVTDSRGNETVEEINVTVLDYEDPSAMIDIKRRDNFYSETDLIVNPHYSSLDGNNTVSITTQYKPSSDSIYGNTTNVTAGQVTTLTLDNTKAFNVKVTVLDRLNIVSYILYVEKGLPILFADRNKSSVGINCFPKDDNSLEVMGKNIYKALYYQVGDTIAVSDIYCAGNTTSSNTKLYFSIPLAKSLDDVKSITLTEMKLNVRHGNGGYTLSNDYVTGGYDILLDSSITVTYDIKTGANMVTFILSKTSAYNGVNNTPETIQVHSIKFTCN